MLTYLYHGLDRFELPTEPDIPVEVDEIYRVNHQIGFFLIAYPKKNEFTDVESLFHKSKLQFNPGEEEICKETVVWTELIKIRDICNISIEEKRASKEIGSSLEADLKIQLSQRLKKITEHTDFSELCITSKAEVSYKDDIETIAITSKAKGTKCPVCWKINEGPCPRHPQ